MKKYLLASIAFAVVPVLASSVAFGADIRSGSYLTDRNGNPVEVRSGGCMRTKQWTPASADKRCKASAEKTSLQSTKSK